MPKTNKDLTRFSAYLNEALDDLGLPPMGKGRQAKCMQLFNKSQPAVHRWLTGQGWPAKKDWHQIAKAAKVQINWLFFDLGPKRAIDNLDFELLVLEAVKEAFKRNNLNVPNVATLKISRQIAKKLYSTVF